MTKKITMKKQEISVSIFSVMGIISLVAIIPLSRNYIQLFDSLERMSIEVTQIEIKERPSLEVQIHILIDYPGRYRGLTVRSISYKVYFKWVEHEVYVPTGPGEGVKKIMTNWWLLNSDTVDYRLTLEPTTQIPFTISIHILELCPNRQRNFYGFLELNRNKNVTWRIIVGPLFESPLGSFTPIFEKMFVSKL